MIEVNRIYNMDNIVGFKELDDESVDVILEDPPYLYLKNQKLDKPFDENMHFVESKRILKRNGFIVLFGRGTSFYRWNKILEDLGFTFKEEVIWDKAYCSSPLMNMSRVHETISIFTKGKGSINRVKVPYLEMKGHDLNAIIADIKRMRSILNNTKSLDAVLSFLENNKIQSDGTRQNLSTTVSSAIQGVDRSVSVVRAMRDGMSEKTIIRTDREMSDRSTKYAVTSDKRKTGDRSVNAMQSISFGLNEKTIIRHPRDHYSAIHPTQKPVQLIERLLALVSKPGDLVVDGFSGSGSTAIAAYNIDRKFVAFEIDEEYYNASVMRLKEVLSAPKQTELFQF